VSLTFSFYHFLWYIRCNKLVVTFVMLLLLHLRKSGSLIVVTQ